VGRVWSILRYCTKSYLNRLKKTMNQYSQPLGWKLNLGSLKHQTPTLSGTLCMYDRWTHYSIMFWTWCTSMSLDFKLTCVATKVPSAFGVLCFSLFLVQTLDVKSWFVWNIHKSGKSHVYKWILEIKYSCLFMITSSFHLVHGLPSGCLFENFFWCNERNLIFIHAWHISIPLFP
jgi:hypothetical protein